MKQSEFITSTVQVKQSNWSTLISTKYTVFDTPQVVSFKVESDAIKLTIKVRVGCFESILIMALVIMSI